MGSSFLNIFGLNLVDAEIIGKCMMLLISLYLSWSAGQFMYGQFLAEIIQNLLQNLLQTLIVEINFQETFCIYKFSSGILSGLQGLWAYTFWLLLRTFFVLQSDNEQNIYKLWILITNYKFQIMNYELKIFDDLSISEEGIN